MRIVVGADHRGYALKETIAAQLRASGHKVLDVGTDSEAPVDYPDYAAAVGRAILNGKGGRGIIICGSGVGASIAANKLPGVRAGLCHDIYSAHQSVEHDDMNILCLGSEVIGPELAMELTYAFLEACFSGEERHCRRLAKVQELEQGAERP